MHRAGDEATSMVLPFELLTPSAWRNGGGVTREVVASRKPEWRLSIASLQESGPFSFFPGLDRTFLVASGGGVTLHVDASAHPLAFGQCLAFGGESTVVADVPPEGGVGVNLMVRRDHGVGTIRVLPVAGSADMAARGLRAVVVLTGELALADGSRLAPLHSLVHLPPSISLVGEGTVAQVIVNASHRPPRTDAG